MVEQKIELEILCSNFKRNLAPDECESHAKFDKKLPQMPEESMLEIALVGLLGESEKVEVVSIF